MDEPIRIPRDSPLYPARLLDRLGEEAPAALRAAGPCRLLSAPLTALFCSTRAPPGVRLATLELARSLADAGEAVVSGFQSPLERDALEVLLRGRGPIVAVPARSLATLHLTPAWNAAVGAGRMLLLSVAPENRRRPDARLAESRNRVVAALATRVVVAYATPAGRLHRLARDVAARGQPLLCLDDPSNRDLVLLGAGLVRGGG